MLNKTHRFFVIGLILFLFIIITWAFRWGLADLISYPAKQQLDLWQEQAPINLSDTTEAMKWIKKARRLDPSNPNYMKYQAQIFQWRARIAKSNNNEFNDHLEKAKELYIESIVLRPTWPFDWIAFASIKAQLQEFDDEFSNAIKRSDELAPWEYQIQVKLIRLGFSHWNNLTSGEQDIIHKSFDRAMQGKQAMHFIKIAKKYEQLELFCARTSMAKDYSNRVKQYACDIKNN